MKLRIRGNSIRLRLTQSEVEKIKNDGLVEEKTEFPNGDNFVYSLVSSEKSDQLSAEFSNGKMQIILPKPVAETWANSVEEGIYGTCENIQIAVEKDFKCLTVRESEDEADNFPHPKTDKIC